MTAAELERRLAAPRGKQSLVDLPAQGAAACRRPNRLAAGGAARRRTLAALTPPRSRGLIKAVPLRLTGIAPIARAISTAGGVAFDELDEHFMLRALPGVFVAGEMLDWEAPTGGYLLQACFATGAAAGAGRWIGCDPGSPEKELENRPMAKDRDFRRIGTDADRRRPGRLSASDRQPSPASAGSAPLSASACRENSSSSW